MALRHLTLAVVFFSAVSLVSAQTFDAGPGAGEPSNSAFGSESSTSIPYSQNANSVTTKPLPSDVLSHCYGNTSNCSAGDAIAKCAMTDCGNLSETGNPSYMGMFYRASPGRDDFAQATYSSASTDPYYTMTTAAGTGYKATANVVFHAPNAAPFPEGIEGSMVIWDQYTGWAVSIYNYSGVPGKIYTLPSANGCGTLTKPCTITNNYKSAATNFFTAPDYNYGPNASSSNGIAPGAARVLEQELQNGAIDHAIMLTVDCVNAGKSEDGHVGYTFPANNAPGLCDPPSSSYFGAQNSNRPWAGTLLFLDYTPAQIAGFGLPAWQKTLLTAMSTYGAYVSETGGKDTGLALAGNENIEGSEAWKYYHGCPTCTTSDPFWPWILGQKGLDGTVNLTHTGCSTGSSGSDQSQYRCVGAILANIPRTLGPEGADTEGNSCTSGSGCYPSGHIHVADICIANGFANRSGGC